MSKKKLLKKTYHGHVLGVPGKLPVEDEADAGLVLLPGVLQRGHVAAVLGPVLGEARHLFPFKFL